MTNWPLEGHFAVGGRGLYVAPECLGSVHATRTANYDVTIGLPCLEAAPGQARVVPPDWTYGPRDEDEEANQRVHNWGVVLSNSRAAEVTAGSAEHVAIVRRCRYFANIEAAASGEDFERRADDFLDELDTWWTRFTAWVGILSSQDFIFLGGPRLRGTKSATLSTWTSDTDGNRAGRDIRSFYRHPGDSIPMQALELRDLKACVHATGAQSPPPAEWMFIRDARSLLNAREYRRAVIDAGTAAELALTALVNQDFDDKSVDPVLRRVLFGNSASLGRKKELLQALRPGVVPSTFQKQLIDTRNNASHGGSSPTLEEALRAVELATEIVEAAHPLSRLLPIQIS